MANFLSKLFGTKSDRDLKELNPILETIKDAYERIKDLSNDALRAKTQEFRLRIQEATREERQQIQAMNARLEAEYDMPVGEKQKLYEAIEKLEDSIYQTSEAELNELLPEAFAVMKETARRFKDNKEIRVTATDFDRDLATRYESVRVEGNEAVFQNSWMAGGNLITWDMCHYDVQLIGGTVLHQGKIAEMATGEGKTLVATLPVYLNALTGDGVHVVTVNDYLAKRDSEWMGMLYLFHGLSVDCIDKHEPNSEERRAAYQADITFGTNNEFGFDYLRDNMARNVSELVQRRHNYAIVDEVDSVLIDDARTPLIISGPTPKGEDQDFDKYKPIVEKLYNAQRQLVNILMTDIRRLMNGNDPKKEEELGKLLLRAHRALPKNKALIKLLSEPGMKQLLLKTESFYMAEQNKNMYIIDDELYFVIEEKLNSVDIKDKGIDLVASDTKDPQFFVIPDMGTELAELEQQHLSPDEKLNRKNELYKAFTEASERIHTVQQLLRAYTMFEKDVEYVIIDNKVKIVDEQTGRIMEGRRYSEGLHQAIEAKENVKVEAATQTYATITLQNYFRMYRKLAGMTGTAETEAGEFWNIYKLDVVTIPTNKPVIREDRDDLIYRSKREKYAAIVDEIIRLHEEGRPVLVGTTSVETSELLSTILTRRHIKHNVLNAKLHKKEADIVAEAGKQGAVTIATNMAGRGTDIKLTPETRALGGLAIIGTERHDSRRVDRQLRGRSGRQGDPGTSQFFVSLEDDLMRLFGSDRIAKVMDRLGFKEGEVIQHSMISRSIEKAQKKVEENNFGIRKRLLEYDDVMSKQRESIYKKRRNALYGDRLSVDIAEMFRSMSEFITTSYQESKDFESFDRACVSIMGCESPVSSHDFFQTRPESIIEALDKRSYENYKSRILKISEDVIPVIQSVYEREGNRFENIAIPLSDGKKVLQIIAPMRRCLENGAHEVALSIEKCLVLAVIDDAWKEHLRAMDDLKQSVQNASYEQKDPLLIYKLESYDLYSDMLTDVYSSVVSFLCNGQIPLRDPQHMHSAQQPQQQPRLREGREEVNMHTNAPQQREVTQPIKVEKKIGRNDPCPCGSGKKYKNCHGRVS
ncbi:MAG: preprotein translocase subunit SecA [Bacteroidales bacterium]|nr:preprotein translocase subunit SecA [Bacteroidales bacterium]